MAKKQITKKKTRITAESVRKVDLPKYKSFRMHKRIKHPGTKLSGSFKLLKKAGGHIRKHWRVFMMVAAVYFLLNVLLVKGLSASLDVGAFRDAISELIGGNLGRVTAGLALFGVLVTSSTQGITEAANVYHSLVLVIISLAVIWILRQTHAGNAVRAKEAFYRGMYPLVPFILVLLVIGLQLLPFLFGTFILNIVVSGGLAITFAEQFLWWTLLFLTALLSLYMVTSSVFALFIVTLADVTPMQALRSARELVRHRRWVIMRKVVFIPVALIILAACIMIPVILIIPVLAEWIFVGLLGIGISVLLSYGYSLYRELL